MNIRVRQPIVLFLILVGLLISFEFALAHVGEKPSNDSPAAIVVQRNNDNLSPHSSSNLTSDWTIDTYFRDFVDGYVEGSISLEVVGGLENDLILTFNDDEISNIDFDWTGDGACAFDYDAQQLLCVSDDPPTNVLTSFSVSLDFRDRVARNGMYFNVSRGLSSSGNENIDLRVRYKTPQFTFISTDVAQTEHNLGSSVEQYNEQRWVDYTSYLVTTSKFSIGWINTSAIRQNYLSKVGTDNANEAAYAHQFWHIAKESKAEYEDRGTNGFANRFVKHLFDYMETYSPYEGLDEECDTDTWSTTCFMDAANMHGIFELYPGFFNYCSVWSENNENGYSYDEWRDRWISDHNTFLLSTIDDGFDEIESAGELPGWFSSSAKVVFPRLARLVRLDAITYCDLVNIFERENAVIHAPPTGSDLYIEEINQNFPLSVNVIADQFFVSPGDTIQLIITRNTDGSDITTDPDTKYQINDFLSEFATITSDGQLTILRSASPTAGYTPLLYVSVSNGDDQGIGQFAFTDVDSDGDTIVDSYESAIGLDPNVANSPTSDLDADGMVDIYEAVLGTDPNNDDSDADGLNDGDELEVNTNPNNPDSDADGLLDGEEILTYQTLPLNPDTDADSLEDGAEVLTHLTQPNNWDSDNDLCSDGFEIANGSDPLDQNSIPTVICAETVVSGVVLEDTDKDNIGDEGMEGVLLELLYADGSHVLDENGDELSVTTGSIGTYRFTAIEPGEYIIRQIQPSGFADVSELDGGDDSDHNDDGIVNHIPVTLVEGENDSGNNFVERRLATASTLYLPVIQR